MRGIAQGEVSGEEKTFLCSVSAMPLTRQQKHTIKTHWKLFPMMLLLPPAPLQ